MAAKKKSSKTTGNHSKPAVSSNGRPASKLPAPQLNEYGIPDWRLEKPDFEVIEISKGEEVHYEIRGKLDAPVPPIRDSKYLNQKQCVELYRWMLMNRRM